LNRRILLPILLALVALALPRHAAAQGGGKTPDPRPFALFRDLFDTAGDVHGPWVTMTWQPQLQYSWQSDGTPKNNLEPTVSWQAYTWFTPELTMNVNLALNQVNQGPTNDDWAAYGMGAQAGDVWLQWSDQRTGIIGGRFTAPFGLAPLLLPGVFDTNLVNNYNFGGLMGGLGTLSTGDEGLGIHALNASFFGIDTTFMANNVFVATPQATGPGTGGGVDSWSIGYSAENVPLIFPTLQWNLSYIQFGDGRGAPENQKGFNAGAYWQYVVNNDGTDTLDAQYWSVGPLVEYVRFWNADGLADSDSEYFTVGIISNYGNWQTDFTWGYQELSGSGQASPGRTQLFTANLGYNFFGPQSLVQVGYAYQDTEGQSINHQVGLQVNFPITILEWTPLWE
jgi:hypothetical protein